MAISIDWGNTYIIDVPLSSLTLVSGTLYDFDVNAFRLELKDLEDSEAGMPFPKTHRHNTEVTIAGTTYARQVLILPPYSVRFPDQAISVRLQGANNNVFDVGAGILVQNQAQIIPNNSAGATTAGFTEQDQQRLLEILTRLDLNIDKPQTYTNDGSVISNDDFTLTKSDNGNGTFTIQKT